MDDFLLKRRAIICLYCHAWAWGLAPRKWEHLVYRWEISLISWSFILIFSLSSVYVGVRVVGWRCVRAPNDGFINMAGVGVLVFSNNPLEALKTRQGEW